jgi:hypothetical protein
MRVLFALMVLSSLQQPSLAADAMDTPQTRHEAALRYVATADLKIMLVQTVESLVRSLPPERHADFRRLMFEHVSQDFVRDLMVAAMTKHFTAGELNALAEFFGSDVGRSAMSKYPSYMGDVIPLLQAEVQRALLELQLQKAAETQQSGT